MKDSGDMVVEGINNHVDSVDNVIISVEDSLDVTDDSAKGPSSSLGA